MSAPHRPATPDWNRTYQLVAVLAHRLGRLPKISDGAPSAIVGWMANQRRATGLTVQQREALERLPGWSWDPRLDSWVARAEEVRLFVRVNGRLPRVRARAESALAHWYSRQCIARENGSLSPERTIMLEYALRGLRRP